VAALQTSLAAKEQQLMETQQQLADALIMIRERTFVAAAHQRAEVALAGHASQITNELATCASDLDAVFGRLDQVVQLQGDDRWDTYMTKLSLRTALVVRRCCWVGWSCPAYPYFCELDFGPTIHEGCHVHALMCPHRWR
jgi:hypothetical protein